MAEKPFKCVWVGVWVCGGTKEVLLSLWHPQSSSRWHEYKIHPHCSTLTLVWFKILKLIKPTCISLLFSLSVCVCLCVFLSEWATGRCFSIVTSFDIPEQRLCVWCVCLLHNYLPEFLISNLMHDISTPFNTACLFIIIIIIILIASTIKAVSQNKKWRKCLF